MAEIMDPKDREHLQQLRKKSQEEHATLINDPEECRKPGNFGEKLAERITGAIATWKFILIQTGIILGWTSYNVFIKKSAFDPYPFILLNLFLSFQSAYTAPAIMMNQKRQEKNDQIRKEIESDVNVKADLEIAQLHDKIEHLTKLVEKLAGNRCESSSYLDQEKENRNG
ncbi:DUF1003 domain-containing protein [Rahnella perminowiae]|jgi:uncharacterized membrane protein|uniref:DUF1003 domain-containing protein n=2 Tax=Rahnella TaxID=34037 RepID=A0ABS6KYM1_9GAMM|nr:DUF1003 domain-containing protein [Rahnella perminowiae]MBU9824224.1 DUF1003 domain-containing protein [Rahnella perminowiae]MBU9834687.1 DUF1003 domain-containing protein [Rahnella perminowiae]MCX2945076.1 DUF1003 domain-containing protein [Rahnella perminowiae]